MGGADPTYDAEMTQAMDRTGSMLKCTLNDWFATRRALGALGAFSLIFLNDFAAIPPVPTYIHALTCNADMTGQDKTVWYGTVHTMRIKAFVAGSNSKARRKEAVSQWLSGVPL